MLTVRRSDKLSDTIEFNVETSSSNLYIQPLSQSNLPIMSAFVAKMIELFENLLITPNVQ